MMFAHPVIFSRSFSSDIFDDVRPTSEVSVGLHKFEDWC